MSDITDRVARLEDRAELQDLIVRYFLASDGDDVDVIRGAFAPGATFAVSGNICGTGPDAIVDFIVEQRGNMGLTVHTPNFALFTFDSADEARGLVGAHLELVLAGQSVFGAVRYQDQYVRTDGRWVFKARDLRTIHIAPWDQVADAFASATPQRWPGTAPSPSDYPRGLGLGFASLLNLEPKGKIMTLDATEQLIEKAAIERMMYDYSYHLDMNHPDQLAALFVEDCEVSYAPNFGATGMGAYKKTLEGIGTFFKGTSHHNSNITVDFVSPTEANVRSIVLAIHRYVKERPDGILYGQYFDTVVKADGQWKFKRRELRTTMTTDYHVKAANPIGRAE